MATMLRVNSPIAATWANSGTHSSDPNDGIVCISLHNQPAFKFKIRSARAGRVPGQGVK